MENQVAGLPKEELESEIKVLFQIPEGRCISFPVRNLRSLPVHAVQCRIIPTKLWQPESTSAINSPTEHWWSSQEPLNLLNCKHLFIRIYLRKRGKMTPKSLESIKTDDHNVQRTPETCFATCSSCYFRKRYRCFVNCNICLITTVEHVACWKGGAENVARSLLAGYLPNLQTKEAQISFAVSSKPNSELLWLCPSLVCKGFDI